MRETVDDGCGGTGRIHLLRCLEDIEDKTALKVCGGEDYASARRNVSLCSAGCSSGWRVGTGGDLLTE